MTRTLSTLASLALVALTSLGAQQVAAQETEEVPPVNPVGAYDFALGIDGQEIYGLMTIAGSADEGFTGSLESEMGGAAISDITVKGQTVTFQIPEVESSVTITFEGTEFTGAFSGAMGQAEFWGTKREGG